MINQTEARLYLASLLVSDRKDHAKRILKSLKYDSLSPFHQQSFRAVVLELFQDWMEKSPAAKDPLMGSYFCQNYLISNRFPYPKPKDADIASKCRQFYIDALYERSLGNFDRSVETQSKVVEKLLKFDYLFYLQSKYFHDQDYEKAWELSKRSVLIKSGFLEEFFNESVIKRGLDSNIFTYEKYWQGQDLENKTVLVFLSRYTDFETICFHWMNRKQTINLLPLILEPTKASRVLFVLDREIENLIKKSIPDINLWDGYEEFDYFIFDGDQITDAIRPNPSTTINPAAFVRTDF